MKRAAEKQLTRDDVEAATDETASDNPSLFQRAAPDVLAKRRILKLPKPPVDAAAQPAPESAPSDKVEDADAANAPDVTADASTAEQQPKPPDSHKHAKSAENAPADKSLSVEHKPLAPTSETPHSSQVESGLKNDESAPPEEGRKTDQDPSEKSTSPAVPPVAKANASEQPPTEKDVDGQTPKEDEKQAERVETEPADQNGTTVAESQADNVAEKAANENANDVATDSKRASVNANETGNDTKPFTKLGSKPAIIFGGGGSNNIKSFATAAKFDGSFKFNAGGVAAPSSNAQSHEFKEQPVTSGEEDEETLFRMRTKLYSLEGETDKMRWRECGVGPLKMNQHKENKRVRLLMRSEGVLRVILNTPLLKHVKLDRATERSVRFQGFEERSSKCYLLRFATRDACAEFIAAVDKWKESSEEE